MPGLILSPRGVDGPPNFYQLLKLFGIFDPLRVRINTLPHLFYTTICKKNETSTIKFAWVHINVIKHRGGRVLIFALSGLKMLKTVKIW